MPNPINTSNPINTRATGNRNNESMDCNDNPFVVRRLGQSDNRLNNGRVFPQNPSTSQLQPHERPCVNYNVERAMFENDEMTLAHQRIRSFENESWKEARKNVNFPNNITDIMFAKSGFYSIGVEDQVKCFACGGGVKGWEKEDTPDIQHAKIYPHCYFIIKRLDSNVINEMQQRQKQLRSFQNYPEVNDLERDLNKAKYRLFYKPNVTQQHFHSLKKLEDQLREKKILDNGEYKFILDSLIEKPDLIEEITAIIEDIVLGYCRTQADMVCNRIRVRLFTASILEHVCDEYGRIDWFLLLSKAKLLFHETMLANTMAELNLFNVHVRAELKDHLSKNVCLFPASDIKGIGSVIYDRDTSQDKRCIDIFKEKINNIEEFKTYIHGMCIDDNFKSFIIEKDEDYAVKFTARVSELEIAMEVVDNIQEEIPENEYVEYVNKLKERNETEIPEILKNHINEKIYDHWNTLK